MSKHIQYRLFVGHALIRGIDQLFAVFVSFRNAQAVWSTKKRSKESTPSFSHKAVSIFVSTSLGALVAVW